MRIAVLRKFACLGLFSVIFNGCSLNIPPPDQFSDPDAITTVATARSFLTSAYRSYPHYEYELSILGADFAPNSLTNKDMDLQNFYRWQDSSISKFATDVWLSFYNTIALCDVLLERIKYVQVETDIQMKDKSIIEAETKILRSMCYFNLLRLFAPAYDRNPDADGIVLKTKVGLEFPKRTSIRICVETIRNWLLEASTVDNVPQQNGWFSQKAAYYLLAELELYAGNYLEAARYAEILLSDVKDRYFTSEGIERTWAEQSYAGRIFAFYTNNTYYTGLLYEKEKGDFFIVNPDIVYDEKDLRKPYYLYPFNMSGKDCNLLGKYNLNNRKEKKSVYVNMMRYSGAYFIAAEAYSRISDKEEKARTTINHFLGLVQAKKIADNVRGTELTEGILQEKQKEFLGEGVFYFDMKRTHINSLKRLNTWGSLTHSLITAENYRWTFPIPATEYRYNKNVTQNEGWPINR